MASIMASSTLADAPRDWRISADSDEPELLSLDDASSTVADDDLDSSDFSTEDENAS